MSRMEQQTVAGSFTLEGVGIHTGKLGRVTVYPADVDAGRSFQVGGITIPAHADFVTDTSRSTRLGRDGATVSTVEHLLSALHAWGVDNARIVVEGPEIPILDGSAAPFAEAVQQVGVRGQGKAARTLSLQKPVILEQRGTRFTAEPAQGLYLSVRTEFEDWPEGSAVCRADIRPETAAIYQVNIAPARTFAFRAEVEQLLKAGLALGGSLDNALIITPPDGFSTPLRVPQEWCEHKMLDLIGDLALANARLELQVDALRPGHRANVAFVMALLESSRTERTGEMDGLYAG
ncbi:MAG: UDP-3-O-[3-hydroxymyristoyl] N-acetylglucosamine deacetylase [Chthonomonadales bacterium]|nr:UDP-3-O-[3-hydroxymyristoyl] N-acetylglucosamine deacetylase [Chthonomonadales bacterium]